MSPGPGRRTEVWREESPGRPFQSALLPRRLLPPAFAILLSLISPSAWADRGAVSADIGGGFDGMVVPVPYVEGTKTPTGAVPSLTLGGRYAARNWLEISLSGFFSFPLTYWHDGGTVLTPGGALPGSLSHQMMSWGGTVGARLTRGEELRFVLGVEVGWMHRAYSQFTAWNDTTPSNVAPYVLTPSLPDVSIDDVLVAPLFGLEWAGGDHWAVALVPRVQIALGNEGTIGVMVPLTFSWSWYL